MRYISTILFLVLFSYADAYDPLDPTGNVTIKWDVMSWTSDGYIATVTLTNFQTFRHIISPGWTIGWAWKKKEVIWSMQGAQATEQGDCSKFKANIPHSCKRNPAVVDLMPTAPFNQRFANCCKGGQISAWDGQDLSASISQFQITVGLSGTTNKTIKLPKNFTLLGPGPGYTCGPAKFVPPSKFFTPDGHRRTQALLTWNITCTYSQFMARKNPNCCVSFSSFYSQEITRCPTCACGCQNNNTCVNRDSKILQLVNTKNITNDTTSLLQCTHHMCPIRVHWHVKTNYKEYWRVKIAIVNFDYRMNYSLWSLVMQHPNLNNVTQVFSFNYHPLIPYKSINDTGLFSGMKSFNDVLMQAGPSGNVQSEVLMQKDENTFTFKLGWAFPRKVYFNGDECILPPPDSYPLLPSSAHKSVFSCLVLLSTLLLQYFLC
ncbi:COBRA-like protein 4 [Euphorbia lathyris]|uniref:COBRA-like protein 4 n=1 Tax=Euphorbia lathyris TaxID=212925 RepID=UPI00331317F7